MVHVTIKHKDKKRIRYNLTHMQEKYMSQSTAYSTGAVHISV